MQHRSPYHDEPESKSSYDAGDRDFSSPVKGGGGGGANVHRTPSGALTRDVFRSPGGGGAGGFGGDADYDSDGGDYSAPAPVVKSPMSRFPGEGGSYQPDDGTGPDAEEPPPKEEFPEGSHPLDGIALLNENGTDVVFAPPIGVNVEYAYHASARPRPSGEGRGASWTGSGKRISTPGAS